MLIDSVERHKFPNYQHNMLIIDINMIKIIVTPQKYPKIFIIKIIIYFGYKLSKLGYFLRIVKWILIK